MFNKMMTKINNWFTEPINEALRKSPQMVAAKTEADILKAEEEFKPRESPSGSKSSRGSVRLVPRHPKDSSSNKRTKTGRK
jgi:hypothetical protein